jgi:putative FmdB family regulatory protein
MPFYEYQCGQCGFQVEVMQKISDSPLRKCPSCGKSALKKLISAPVFRLKGSGWYETDFKGDKDNKRNLAESAPAPDSAAADKPADKPADKAVDKPADKPAEKPAAKPDKAADKPAAKPVAAASTAKRSARKAAPAKVAKKKTAR